MTAAPVYPCTYLWWQLPPSIIRNLITACFLGLGYMGICGKWYNICHLDIYSRHCMESGKEEWVEWMDTDIWSASHRDNPLHMFWTQIIMALHQLYWYLEFIPIFAIPFSSWEIYKPTLIHQFFRNFLWRKFVAEKSHLVSQSIMDHSF